MHHPASLARIRHLAPIALVLLSASLVFAAYMQAIDAPFFSDDIGYVTKNTKLAGLHLAELWRLFTGPYNAFSEFLPLRELSYWFDIALFGMNPSAFRVHNIVLYLLCLPLVYGVTSGLWRYFRPTDTASAPWAAAVVTALFALHPAHAEAIVWIAGRKDVLSGMFSLLALWLAVCARREQGLSAPHAFATLVALLAAMLSKATAVAVAPLIALLWVIFWRDIAVSDRRRSMLLWPLASLLLAVCIALVFATAISRRIPLYFGIEAISRTLAALGWLARLTVSPESRHFFYPVFEDPYLPAMVTLGVAVLAVSVAGMVMMLRKRSLEGFALAAFLLLCMPYLQLIPYAPPSLVSDRFVFLAVWPALLLLVVLSWRLKPPPRIALLLAFALSWSLQTTERPRDWRSFEAVIDADLRAFPGYYMPAMFKIAAIQLPQGLIREASETANSIANPELRDIVAGLIRADYALSLADSTGKPQEAMALLRQLGFDLKQPPPQAKWNPTINSFWGQTLSVLTDEWEYLAKHFPGDASIRYNAGLWMLNIHEYEYAAAHLRAAVETRRLTESVRGIALRNLGLALIGSGHVAEAEAPLRAALEQAQPDLRAFCLLAKVYRQAKRLEDEARAEAGCATLVPDKEAAQ